MSQEAPSSLLTVLELCTGGGGQALGLEMAGFECAGAIDNDERACETLNINRPNWRVQHLGIEDVSGSQFRGVDLLAAGVPCPPFSIAGKQLGASDERDLFPTALRLVAECRPRAVMLENVRGILDRVFADYRRSVLKQLRDLGYVSGWRLLNACHFGV